LIRGKRIDDALAQLEFSKKRAAWYFKSVLNSAIANAEEQDADVSALYVSERRNRASNCAYGRVVVKKSWRWCSNGKEYSVWRRTSTPSTNASSSCCQPMAA
ncbi:MAG TPA: hypothetical protein EYQ02_03870, partial [Microbacterium sp.]|nr:hypothetical protein [Microbacterium sp.]